MLTRQSEGIVGTLSVGPSAESWREGTHQKAMRTMSTVAAVMPVVANALHEVSYISEMQTPEYQ